MVRSVLLLIALLVAACVVPPPPGTPVPPQVEVLAKDPGAIGKPGTAAGVLEDAGLMPRVRALFGADWIGGAQPGRGFDVPAPAFFSRAAPGRVVRIGQEEWLAAPGCRTGRCAVQRGLLLVRADGERFLARLDDGGFSHYFVHGPGIADTPDIRVLIDAVWRAVPGAVGD